MGNNIEQYLASKRKQVNGFLCKYLPGRKTVPTELYKAMRYGIASGGKRLRPILTLATGEMLGAKGRELQPIASAIEFIHTYSLIHDDLPAMDDDDFRRGKPTVHKAFGEALAILAGDALLTRTFEVIAGGIKNGSLAQQLTLEIAFAAGASGMVGGQVLDLQFAKSKKADNAFYIKTLRMKTAALIKASVSCGAIAAGADSKSLSRLSSYGEQLGLAFQLKDDILDSRPSPVQSSGYGAADGGTTTDCQS